MSFWGAGANKRNRSRKMRNRASVYADVNQHRPREYWNYEALTIQWGYAFLFRLIVRSQAHKHRFRLVAIPPRFFPIFGLPPLF